MKKKEGRKEMKTKESTNYVQAYTKQHTTTFKGYMYVHFYNLCLAFIKEMKDVCNLQALCHTVRVTVSASFLVRPSLTVSCAVV